MQQIINFFLRNKNSLLFLLLFFLGIILTIQSHSYHKSKFINSANFLSGGVYESFSSLGDYFNLKEENAKLLEENNRLKSILFNNEDTSFPQTENPLFEVTSAKVIKNSYRLPNNHLLINKGKNDSIQTDQGVITSKGIVGIIDKTSNNHARVLSILNTTSKVNAQLKKSNHFGVLEWNAESPHFVQLVDVQKQAPVTVGDTIVTGGNSSIFPKGILIGTVENFSTDETENYYSLQVKLFNDMTSFGHVHVIKNLDREEILLLENNENE